MNDGGTHVAVNDGESTEWGTNRGENVPPRVLEHVAGNELARKRALSDAIGLSAASKTAHIATVKRRESRSGRIIGPY